MFPGTRLYLGTDDGLRVIDGEEMMVTGTALAGQPVRDIAVHPTDADTAWAGCALGGKGLYKTTDAGETVESVGFEDRWVWGVDWLPDGHLYVGTEPPDLYRADGSEEFTALDGVHKVPTRDDWVFGYEPFEAGHIHGTTAHPACRERLFAAVEVGGVIVSEDGGSTWQARLPGADVHRLAIAPDDPDRVFAATETGIYESDDGGTSWWCVDTTDGLYVKLLEFGPDGTLYAPAANDMGDTAVQLFTYDGSWNQQEQITGASVLAFAVVDGTVLLQEADGSGRLLIREDCSQSWTATAPTLPRVRCIQPVSI